MGMEEWTRAGEAMRRWREDSLTRGKWGKGEEKKWKWRTMRRRRRDGQRGEESQKSNTVGCV